MTGWVWVGARWVWSELFADGADEVGQEAVAGGVNAGIVFDEGEAEDVEIEADGRAAAFEVGERVGREEQFGLHTAIDARAAAVGAADELVAHSGISHGADFFFAEIANAGAANLIELERHTEKDDRERGDFHGGVPSIQIRRRIGFGDSHLLRAANCVFE
jgi:hypothetical protein